MKQKRLILPMERSLLTQINEQQYRFGKSKPTEIAEEKGLYDVLSSAWKPR